MLALTIGLLAFAVIVAELIARHEDAKPLDTSPYGLDPDDWIEPTDWIEWDFPDRERNR